MAGDVGKFKVSISGDLDDLKKLGKEIQDIMSKLKAPEVPAPKMPKMPDMPPVEIPKVEMPKGDWGLAGAIGDKMKGIGSKITAPLQDAFEKASKGIGEKVGGPLTKGLSKVVGESGVEAAKAFGEKFKDNLPDIASDIGSKVGGGAKTALKGITAGVGVAAAGVATLATAAVKSYADYEQLTGGVEKLFGDSADDVQAYAANAYKTAGLSANEYMEQATAVAAFTSGGIITIGGKLQTQADVVNTALTDMSDNANTFGTDIGSIQNAYSGFAKGNFTMLDNLKLGFSGSQDGMADLINSLTAGQKASLGLSDSFVATASNVKDIPYDTVVGAIHAVQEGTVQLTDGTITSANAMQFQQLTAEQTAEAMKLIAENNTIAGTTAKEASGTISGSFMSMQSGWENVLTGFAVGGPFLDNALSGFASSVNDFANNIIKILPQVFDGITQGVTTLVPTMVNLIVALIPQLVDLLVTALPALVTAIVTQLPVLLATVVSALTALFPLFLDLVVQLALAIVNALPGLIIAIVGFLISAIPQLITAALELFMGIVMAIPQIIAQLVAALPTIIVSIVSSLIGAIPLIIGAAFQLLFGIISAIPQIVVALIAAVPTLVQAITNGLLESLPEMIDAGFQLINGLVEGLQDFDLGKVISDIGNNIVNGFKDFFGIHSPSLLMQNIIGKQLGAGLAVGLDISTDDVLKSADELSESLTARMTPDLSSVGSTRGRGDIIIQQKIDSPKTMLDIQLNTQKGLILAESQVGAA